MIRRQLVYRTTFCINVLACMAVVEKFVSWRAFFEDILWLYQLVFHAPIRWLNVLFSFELSPLLVDFAIIYVLVFWASDAAKRDETGTGWIERSDFNSGRGDFIAYFMFKGFLSLLVLPFYILTYPFDHRSRYVMRKTVQYALRVVLFVGVFAFLNWTLFG